MHLNTEQGGNGVVCRARVTGSTGLQIPSKVGTSALSFQCDTELPTASGGREFTLENLRRLKTRQFAMFWMSCRGTKRSTLTGWLTGSCLEDDLK